MNSALSGDDREVNKLLGPDRRQQILDVIYRQGNALVHDLSEQFGVSKVTIRSDLDWLAEHQLIERARGGAVAPSSHAVAAAYSQRSVHNLEEKTLIAKAAIGLIQPHETVILDAGSTVYEFSRGISNGASLTVVTPALNVASHVAGLPDIELVIIGGRLDPRTLSPRGPMAEQAILDIPAHRVFLGAHAIDRHGGVVDVSVEVARLKRAMVKAAGAVVLLADLSKWGGSGQARVIELDAIHAIVTDAGLPEWARALIQEAGVQLVIA